MFLFFSLHLPTNYLYTVLGCMTRDTGIWYYLLQDKFNLFVGENGISSSEWTWRHVPAVTEGIKINNWSTCYCLDLFSHIPHSDVWVVGSLQLSGLHFIKNVPNRPCFPAHEEPHSLLLPIFSLSSSQDCLLNLFSWLYKRACWKHAAGIKLEESTEHTG